jgi:hypothetical protein
MRRPALRSLDDNRGSNKYYQAEAIPLGDSASSRIDTRLRPKRSFGPNEKEVSYRHRGASEARSEKI